MSLKIDTLEEKKKWYAFVKERIELLKTKEKDEGELMLTEVREHITLAMAILERIRAESSKLKESSSDVKNKTFSPWEKTLEVATDFKEKDSRRETE